MSDANKTAPKPFTVPCIKCFDPAACVCLDLDGSDNFRCLSCEEEFSRDDVQAVIDAAKPWAKLLTWLDSYPTD